VTSGQVRTRWRRTDPRRQPHRPARRRAPTRFAAVVVALAAVVIVAGCGKAGHSAAVPPRTMSISSEALSQYILPQRYTCHGNKINPPLEWSGAPAGTKSFALVVDDSSAPITPFIYWLVFDIGPGTADIQEGALPTGARQAMNSAATASYDAPCPSGQPHMYRFTIYALNSWLNLPNGASLPAVLTAIAADTIGRGRIVVTGNP